MVELDKDTMVKLLAAGASPDSVDRFYRNRGYDLIQVKKAISEAMRELGIPETAISRNPVNKRKNKLSRRKG